MQDPSLTLSVETRVTLTSQQLEKQLHASPLGRSIFCNSNCWWYFQRWSIIKMLICFRTFILGMCVCSRWTNYTPWCFPFSIFFYFQETKINCVRLATKGTWVSFFSAKHNASNIKAAVVTRLDYSYYSWRKPIIIIIIVIYYYRYFIFEGRYWRPNMFPEPLHYMCKPCYFWRQGISLCLSVVPPFPCSIDSFPALRTILAIGRMWLKKLPINFVFSVTA